MRLKLLIRDAGRIFHWRRPMAVALASAACVLTGCAAVSGARPYGNHVAASTAFDQKLAGDAIQQLAALYPPASTQFNLVQSTPDAFGTALVAGLREKGFALMEAKAGIWRSVLPDTSGTEGLELRYLLDQPGDGELYRLTLAIGTQRLSRPYLIQNGTPSAAGAWMRKE